MKLRPASKRNAFTLLEIMLVVAIITLLLGTGFMMLGKQFGAAQDTKTAADISSIGGALKQYEMMSGGLPSSEQGLQALVVQPQSEPKPARWYQYMSKIPKDAWNGDYVYICPGKHNPDSFDLYTKGKDKQEGTADDQGNWENK